LEIIMKKLQAVLIASLMSFGSVGVAVACKGEHKDPAAEKQGAGQKVEKLATVSFRVSGMSCEGCSDKVKTALSKTDGVVKVDVKLADHRIVVDFDAAKTSADKLAKLITDLGYKASAEA
jgi:copper ion binding protein